MREKCNNLYQKPLKNPIDCRTIQDNLFYSERIMHGQTLENQRKSKIRWLHGGGGCSQKSYACMRNKRNNKIIKHLIDASGNVITNIAELQSTNIMFFSKFILL